MPVENGINQLLNAEDMTRLSRLSLGSRFTVEGTMTGAHRSQLKGISVEFADYRQYVAGDDPKHLDWKVYGKNERLYLRQYEEETSLRVHLLVDASRSMTYASDEKADSKYRYASRLAAALAYITVHQQDSVGLALFDSRCRALLPAKSGPEHLRTICNTLVGHKPTDQTDLAVTLHSLAEQSRRRGLVVIFSDLFDDIEKIRPALSHFRRKKHDVIVYQILDRQEIDFSFRDATAFVDLETGERIVTNPKDVRASYQQAVERFLGQCREACAGLGVEHVLALTDQPPVDIIIRHLRQRTLAGR